jgi:RNA polymerase sigma-70 factor, ECF subfamily
MLRIRSWKEGKGWLVRAEGKLAGSSVDELRRVLGSLGTSADQVSLDLAEVGYVDAAGEQLLRERLALGTRILSRSAYVAALTSDSGAPAGQEASSVPANDRDRTLVEAALAGEEAAFALLVQRHHGSMLRVALCYVRSRAIAEEVIQETWLLVLQGMGRWEGRGSFRAWVLTIVANRARHCGKREQRSVPFSALGRDDGGSSAAPCESACEVLAGSPVPGNRWPDPVESRETLEVIRSAIDALPATQRAVILFRDMAGCDAKEACAALRLSAENQRVLLHRARVKVRAALGAYFSADAA